MCRLPKNVPSMDFLQFSLNCSLSPRNLLCVVLLLWFFIPPFHLPPLSCFVCLSVPWSLSPVFSLSLCCLSLSNHFFHTLSTVSPLSPLCLSASLIPLPICVFFSLLPQPHFLPFCPLFSFYRLFLSQLECDNFITVIQKVNDTIIVCGTNAGSPRCWMLVRVSSDHLKCFYIPMQLLLESKTLLRSIVISLLFINSLIFLSPGQKLFILTEDVFTQCWICALSGDFLKCVWI